jgi:hypothetical protein
VYKRSQGGDILRRLVESRQAVRSGYHRVVRIIDPLTELVELGRAKRLLLLVLSPPTTKRSRGKNLASPECSGPNVESLLTSLLLSE